MSEPTVRAATKRLAAAGYITITTRWNPSKNEYHSHQYTVIYRRNGFLFASSPKETPDQPHAELDAPKGTTDANKEHERDLLIRSKECFTKNPNCQHLDKDANKVDAPLCKYCLTDGVIAARKKMRRTQQ